MLVEASCKALRLSYWNAASFDDGAACTLRDACSLQVNVHTFGDRTDLSAPYRVACVGCDRARRYGETSGI